MRYRRRSESNYNSVADTSGITPLVLLSALQVLVALVQILVYLGEGLSRDRHYCLHHLHHMLRFTCIRAPHTTKWVVGAVVVLAALLST
jgi:hypothetical protein